MKPEPAGLAPDVGDERAAAEAPARRWTRRHLLGLEELSRDEIELVLDTAESFREISTRSVKKVPALRGRVVVNLFFEASTRTRVSFGLAAQRLSADVVDFQKEGSSSEKGETLVDTAKNIEAMGVDIFVVRHQASGAPWNLARHLKSSVVNAGDGSHEHPTQGLLDIFTIRQAKGRIAGLEVAIVGDIANSRVARSNIWGLLKLGAKVTVVGPSTLVPSRFRDLGVDVSHDLDAVLPRMDVVNMLRIQRERQAGSSIPSVREYTRQFGLTRARLKRAKPDLSIMHPGPMNRGVEIAPEVADGPGSLVLKQVENGLAVRMAALFLVSGGRPAAREAAPRP